MRKTTLAVVISSVLLGALAARAEPAMDATAGPTPAKDVDTTRGADNNKNVGAKESNVDEKSTSGSYYPYSAGTVGDDPAKPTSTSPTPNAGGDPTEPTDQWLGGDADGDGFLSKDELAKLSPSLAPSFGAMDVDSDGKLTRGEFRTWHESHKARMDADQPTPPRTDGSTEKGSTAPKDKGE